MANPNPRAIWHIHIKSEGHMMMTCVCFKRVLLQVRKGQMEIFGILLKKYNFFKLRGGQPLRKGRDLAKIRQ
jgi:hypothetical protein